MSVFEIVNPSDKCCVSADDPLIAKAAALVLGDGFYGLVDEEGETALPILAFASPKGVVEKYLDEAGLGDIEALLEARGHELADCLDSIAYCSIDEYREFVWDRATVRERNDRERSSLNNIAARAYGLAEAIRKKLEETS